jgi:hypothetical protein
MKKLKRYFYPFLLAAVYVALFVYTAGAEASEMKVHENCSLKASLSSVRGIASSCLKDCVGE